MPEKSDEPLYVISVAARLVDCHPQTLRQYEKLGLVSPDRSDSNARLYSDEDIEQLKQIQRLTQELGVNLAGVEIILNLLDKIQDLRSEVKRLRKDLEQGPPRLTEGRRASAEVTIIEQRIEESDESESQ